MTIRLETIRVKNCFGFLDSDPVNMLEESNLVYILGRNSSGKTALLTAISYLEAGMIPSRYDRFKNFNDSGAPSYMDATFTVELGDLSAAKLMASARKKPFGNPNSDASVSEMVSADPEYKRGVDTILKGLEALYTQLIQDVESAGRIYVRKHPGGSFWFSADGGFKEYGIRDKAFRDAFEKAFPNSQIVVRQQWRRLEIPFHFIENALFDQFPRIVFFDDTYSLIDDLPERITAETLKTDKSQLLQAFVDHLGRTKITRFLEATSPTEQRELETEFNRKLKALTDQVNRYRSSVNALPLLGITVDRTTQGGMQITVTTENKESYYRQISDNTKFLFAYFTQKSSTARKLFRVSSSKSVSL